MKNILLAVLLFIFFVFILNGSDTNLKANYNLNGSIDNVESELVVVFSDDMVPLGTEIENKPIVSIFPGVKGEFIWRGTRTLVFIPESHYNYSTRYKVTIKKGLKSLNGFTLKKKIKWKFSTPVIEPTCIEKDIEYEYEGYNKVWIDDTKTIAHSFFLKEHFFLIFSQEFDLNNLKNKIKLFNKKTKKSIKFKLEKCSKTKVKLIPLERFNRGEDYILAIKKGLRSKSGNLKSVKKYSITLKIEPEFRVIESFKKLHISSDSKFVHIRFSNKIKSSNKDSFDVHRIVRTENEIKRIQVTNFKIDSYNHHCNLIVLDRLNFGDEFVITVKDSIRNIYNEKLSKNSKIKVKVCSNESGVSTDAIKGNLIINANSIKDISYEIFKLDDSFINHLNYKNYGIFNLENFNKKYVNKIQRKTLHILKDSKAEHFVRTNDKDYRFGFIGFKINSTIPYDYCNTSTKLFFSEKFTPPFVVTHKRNIDLVVRSGGSKTLVWVYNNRTIKPVPHAEVVITRGKDILSSFKADINGFVLINKVLSLNDLITAINPEETSDRAFYKIQYIIPPSSQDYRLTIFSDKDIYLPGEEVHIGGIVREYKNNKINSPEIKIAVLVIKDPNKNEIKRESIDLDDLGSFTFKLKEKTETKGKYLIYLFYENKQKVHSIKIDYFQPDKISLQLTGLKQKYFRNNLIEFKLRGEYLNGNPMAEEKLKINMKFYPIINNFGVIEDPFISDYSFSLSDYFCENKTIEFKENFDNDGSFDFKYNLKHENTVNYISQIRIESTGITPEDKEVSTIKKSVFLPGDLIPGLKLSEGDEEREIIAEIILLDPNFKRTLGKVDVEVLRRDDIVFGKISYFQKKYFKNVDIKKYKKIKINLNENGYYLIKCSAIDSKGNTISSSAGISVSGWKHDKELSLNGKAVFKIGETGIFKINSKKDGYAIITIEKKDIVDYFLIPLKDQSEFKLKIKEKYFPEFKINAIGVIKDFELLHVSKKIHINKDVKKLSIDVFTNKEFKPASQSKIRIKIKDHEGIGCKSKAIVYCVDKGIHQLSGYSIPDFLNNLYKSSGFGFFRTEYTNIGVRNTWFFKHPDFDLGSNDNKFIGRVVKTDGTPLSNVLIKVINKEKNIIFETNSSAKGYFALNCEIEPGFKIQYSKEGYRDPNKNNLYFILSKYGNYYDNFFQNVLLTDREYNDIFLKYKDSWYYYDFEGGVEGGVEGGIVGGVLGGVKKRESLSYYKKNGIKYNKNVLNQSNFKLRKNFRDVLLFKIIETDENGNAEIQFKTSDLLSTFRFVVLAYTQDSFGSTVKDIVVTKDILLEEAMPEFSVSGDIFVAGVRVSNRKKKSQSLNLKVITDDYINISKSSEFSFSVLPKNNKYVNVHFKAVKPGLSKVKFFLQSNKEKDAIQKNILVIDNSIMESVLDFDSGMNFHKQVEINKNSLNNKIKLTIDNSLMKSICKISEKLIFYPYECLEQRISKIMPYLILDKQITDRFIPKISENIIKNRIKDFIKIIPEYKGIDGGLSYFRGRYSSDYVTTYALWSLYLARERGFDINKKFVASLENYLDNLSIENKTTSFYQYIRSLNKKASRKVLKKLFLKRDALSFYEKAFLFRAINNQLKDKKKLKIMLDEFNKHLEIGSDFAYFKVKYKYFMDMPFSSTRYITALLMQAIIEVNKEHFVSSRIIKWLINVSPHQWNTTQNNFWIIYALNEFIKTQEEGKKKNVIIKLQNEEYKNSLLSFEDKIEIESKIDELKDNLEYTVNSNGNIYLTSELTSEIKNPGKKNRGVEVIRNIYNKNGNKTLHLIKGGIYQIEILINPQKEIPYCVIDSPNAAGFEVIRQDLGKFRKLPEFNSVNNKKYFLLSLKQENSKERTVFYSYSIRGKSRIVYFIKALYNGEFSWLPTMVSGMYHPQYYGRTKTEKLIVK